MLRGLARAVQREASRRASGQSRTLQLLLIIPGGVMFLLSMFVVLMICVIFAVVVAQNAGGCGTTVPVGAPTGAVLSPAAVVQYFESQGISANGSAGIVGNLQQESGLNPKEAGGGLAQWGGARWTAMLAWTTAHGYPGDSANAKTAMAGQLMFIVNDLRTKYASLLTILNGTPDPGTAATAFETTYELCSGVTGFMQVTPGSLCNDPARQANAVAALGGKGTAVPVSLAAGGTCVAVGGGGGDPIPGFTPGRDDMGVDACAKKGMSIYAPADSVLARIIPNWYQGQPLEVFRFVPPLAGTYQSDQYWFVAEQIIPASMTIGTPFAAGQPVAFYAETGTCIEIGWGSMTTGSGTLVPTDAHPPPGALTPEAEAFKTYFHIPWIGRSP